MTDLIKEKAMVMKTTLFYLNTLLILVCSSNSTLSLAKIYSSYLECGYQSGECISYTLSQIRKAQKATKSPVMYIPISQWKSWARTN